MFPMSTLTVAAWTPESGMLIGWMGDSLPFVATAGPDGFSGYCCGRPHRHPGGSIDLCLGMPPMGADIGAGLVEVEIVGESGSGERPDAVILATDGAWEPFVYRHGVRMAVGRLDRRRHRRGLRAERRNGRGRPSHS